MKQLTVYKASAGSGKTFTLATEYITLLVQDPHSYRSILAVTFTNKATEEMKMRILSQLYGIWKQLPESDDYLQKIRQNTGFEPPLISQRAGIALANLLHNYNYFHVQTIDTFFQRVMRNMARELELTSNLRIGLNDQQVEELAVDQLIEDLTAHDIMLQWIMKYIMENISDDKGWNIIGQVKKFGLTIFRDEYKAVSEQLDQKLQEPDFFESYTSRLRDIRRQAEDRMKEIGESFFDTLEGEGLTVDDLSGKRRGIASFFAKLQRGVFDPSIENVTVAKCLNDPNKWYTQAHPRREFIHSLAENELGSILRFAVEERPRQWKRFKSADVTLRHLNQLRLLSSIEKKVHELNEDNNRFLLSNTQQLLHALIGDDDSPFIFEKIGTQLEHVMIDEFQDTSTVQWQNFKVLLDEAMSHAKTSNLIVGDVKQSIYRWRSGDWRLLNDIQSQFNTQQIDIRSLKVNYRSDRNIIKFNNLFFTKAAEIEYNAQAELNAREADQLRRAYADVCQEIPDKRPDAGFVSVELLPALDYQEATLHRLSDMVSDLIARGVSQQKIAILVRVKRSIPVIARYFMSALPSVPIVSDEAFRLDASNTVCLLVQALRLLSDPTNQLAKAFIVKSYLCDVKGMEADDSRVLRSTNSLDARLPEAFIGHFDELRAMPLYDLVERLYAIFGLEVLTTQNAYVCAFYDSLTEFVNENAGGIDAFLEEWDDNLRYKKIQSDETEGIRIFSIHKSKGLEYDYVICPFCDWWLEKQSDNIIWCQPSEAPFNDLPIAPIDYSQKQMMGTIYEHDYLHEHLQNTVDNLNLLYVAFTRARKCLYVIGRRDDKNSRSALIQQCLPLLSKELPDAILKGLTDNQQPLCFTFGSLTESGVSAKETKAKEDADSYNPFLQPSESILVNVKNFDSKVTFRQSNRSRDFVRGDDEDSLSRHDYIQTGSVLHEIFSTIRTTADIPDALRRLQFEGVLYDNQITSDRITALLRKRLENPRVADWFSPRWQLFNECTILSIEDGQLKERRPDRVMTDGHEWIVVDFKFAAPKPEHHAQVRDYMSLIRSMHPDGVIRGCLWYVYRNQIEEVQF